jgi:hypothetical protein
VPDNEPIDPDKTDATKDEAEAKAAQAQAAAPTQARAKAKAKAPAPAPAAVDDEDDVLAPISPIPPMGRPTRPAWRPMEVGPTARRGVTVFGTRLTYPQAGIGAAALLIVVVLVIVLAVKAFGDDQTATPTATPTTAAQTTAAQATGGASTQPSAAAGATQPSNPATSAAPSSAPPSTPASSAPPNTAVPAGWKAYTQKASGSLPGFTIPIPNGAKVSGGGSEVQIRWNNRLLIVARTGAPEDDAYQDWKTQEKSRRGSYRNYSLIGINKVKYRDFDSAADWEFTYTTDSGNAQHAVKRNIRVDDTKAYSLSWYTTPQDWDAAKTDLQAIYQGFQPK